MNAILKEGKEEKQKFVALAKQLIIYTNELFEPFETNINNCIERSKENLTKFAINEAKKQEKLAEKVESGMLSVEKYADKVHDAKLSGKKTKFELVIEDEKKIPREFLMPDTASIIDALKNGYKVNGAYLKEVPVITLQ